jgi:chromosome partitioning protein
MLPTGLAIDDLQPGVQLAHELVPQIPRQQLVFALCRVGSSQTEIGEAREYLREAGYSVLEGELPEKAAYRRASDEGRTATETHFSSLNRRAEVLAQSVVNRLASLTASQPQRQRRKRHG